MIQAKHTPGPWEIREGTYGHAGTYDWQIVNKDDEYVCDGDGEANARLIAAAPKMYALLAMRAESGDNDAAKLLQEIDDV